MDGISGIISAFLRTSTSVVTNFQARETTTTDVKTACRLVLICLLTIVNTVLYCNCSQRCDQEVSECVSVGNGKPRAPASLLSARNPTDDRDPSQCHVLRVIETLDSPRWIRRTLGPFSSYSGCCWSPSSDSDGMPVLPRMVAHAKAISWNERRGHSVCLRSKDWSTYNRYHSVPLSPALSCVEPLFLGKRLHHQKHLLSKTS